MCPSRNFCAFCGVKGLRNGRPDNVEVAKLNESMADRSTMSRRLLSQPVQQLMNLPDDALSQVEGPPPATLELVERTMEAKVIDAKPLPLGGYSKDRDAAAAARRCLRPELFSR